MTDDERELLAAEYVLGTLDLAERSAFERSLAEDEDLQARVTDWERRLAVLEHDQPPIAPPARLWQAIDQAIDDEGPLTAPKVLRAADRRWRRLLGGIDWLPLYREPEQGWHCFLLRWQPGGALPMHRHMRPEECIVLEGELQMDAESYGPGDYLIVPAGATHPEVTSRTGAIAYIRAAIDAAA